MSSAIMKIEEGQMGMRPRTLDEAMRFADIIAKTDFVPKQYKGRPGDVLVAIQMGAEVGLAPMQSLQNIAVINGRPSVWGDAALALCKAHPSYEKCKEWVEGEGDDMVAYCQCKRRGEEVEIRSFSVDDAKQAQLWGKPGPWQQYPKRMLQLRARGFALRDVWPDALKGLITAEEARDIPTEVVDVTPREANGQPKAPAKKTKTQKAVEALAEPSDDDLELAAILAQLRDAHSRDELNAIATRAKELPEAKRAQVRDAWKARMREIDDEAMASGDEAEVE